MARAAADLVIRMPERIVPAAASSAVPTATVIATGSPEAPAATAAPATATSSATPAAIRQSADDEVVPEATEGDHVAHQEATTDRPTARRRTRTVSQDVASQSTSSTGSAQPPPGHSSDLPSGAKTPRPSTTQNVP